MTQTRAARALALLASVACATSAVAHDGPLATAPDIERDKWIEYGARVHGGFGSLIALGIRIGDDAVRYFQARPRDLDVTYFSGPVAPCACVVDGILVATSASPGQGTLRVAAERTGAEEFGRAEVVHRASGRRLVYSIPVSAWPVLREANSLSIIGRWNEVMAQSDAALFTRTEIAPR